MRIAIIGAGKMGRWFFKYFKKRHSVKLFKRRTPLEQISSFDVVMIAVTLGETGKVIDRLKKYVKGEQIIFDIASVKSHFIGKLKKMKCKTASVHPMFGPSASSLKGRNIVFISDIGDSETKRKIKSLFKGGNISNSTYKKHDEAMAYILALPYIINAGFSRITEGKKLDKLAGPTYIKQKEVADKVKKEGKDFIDEVSRLNPYTKKIVRKYSKIIEKR